VRQTRTITYEKSAAAKISFACFPLEIGSLLAMPRARVRQTRNTSVSSEAFAHADRAWSWAAL
jgi:hypothetical protein